MTLPAHAGITHLKRSCAKLRSHVSSSSAAWFGIICARSQKEENTMTFDRRRFMLALATGAGACALPMRVGAQSEPIRVGLVTVKTGPLASGGIDMERGLQ